MGSKSSPSLELLRESARAQGVSPTDSDLEAVLGFLDAILPALAELERELPPELPPALLDQPAGAHSVAGEGRA